MATYLPQAHLSKTYGPNQDQHIRDHVVSQGATENSSYGVKVDPLKNAQLHIDPTAKAGDESDEMHSMSLSTAKPPKPLTTLPTGTSQLQTGRFFHPIDSYEDLPRAYEIARGATLSPSALRLLSTRPQKKQTKHKRNLSILPLRTTLYPMMEAKKKFKVKEGLQLTERQQETASHRQGVLRAMGFDVSTPQALRTITGAYQKAVSLVNRVDSFESETLRRESYLAQKEQFSPKKKPLIRTQSNMSTTSEKEAKRLAYLAYEHQRGKRLYVEPIAVIPFDHTSKKVTPFGFDRPAQSLPGKIVETLRRRDKANAMSHKLSSKSFHSQFQSQNESGLISGPSGNSSGKNLLTDNTMKAASQKLSPVGARTIKAINYDYIFMPDEEKSIKVKKERAHLAKLQKGVTGAPSYLDNRLNHRLFDLKQLTKEKRQIMGIQQPSQGLIRNQVMSIGQIGSPRRKSLKKKSHLQKINEKLEESQPSIRLPVASSKDIPYNSSYDGENFFRGLATAERDARKVKHPLSGQRDRPLKHNGDKFLSKMQQHSIVERFHVSPVLDNQSSVIGSKELEVQIKGQLQGRSSSRYKPAQQNLERYPSFGSQNQELTSRQNLQSLVLNSPSNSGYQVGAPGGLLSGGVLANSGPPTRETQVLPDIKSPVIGNNLTQLNTDSIEFGDSNQEANTEATARVANLANRTQYTSTFGNANLIHAQIKMNLTGATFPSRQNKSSVATPVAKSQHHKTGSNITPQRIYQNKMKVLTPGGNPIFKQTPKRGSYVTSQTRNPLSMNFGPQGGFPTSRNWGQDFSSLQKAEDKKMSLGSVFNAKTSPR